MYLHVRFYVKSGTNEERGRKVSGYLEIDGRRIRTWKNEDWVSISPLTLSDGDHTIRLVITDNQPAWVEIFEIAIINNNGTVLTELRELPENQK
jgi:cobalamin biosynthesis Co2+ chelatase CbiK